MRSGTMTAGTLSMLPKPGKDYEDQTYQISRTDKKYFAKSFSKLSSQKSFNPILKKHGTEKLEFFNQQNPEVEPDRRYQGKDIAHVMTAEERARAVL